MVSQSLKEIIIKHAEQHKLIPKIVIGICQQESAFNPVSCRYEKNYKWLYKPDKVKPKLCSLDTETVFQQTSWGIMQVMGAVYREYGYTDWLPVIISDIENQIAYGCKHLANLKKRFPDGLDYIAAYNAGSPRKLSSGKYVNQSYIDGVLEFAENFNKSQ